MRVTAISDLHGNLPEIPEGTDVLVIAGDIAPDFYCDPAMGQDPVFHVGRQLTWIAQVFLPFLEEMRDRRIIVIGIAGNHDWWCQVKTAEGNRWADGLPWIYLEDEGIVLGGKKFYGTPWQPEFCDWAYNATEDFMREKFSQIPADVDVLISHGPPNGILDRVGRQNCGSVALNRAVQRVMPPLTVFGHIHRPGVEVVEGCVFANVTVVNEKYELVYEPVSFEV